MDKPFAVLEKSRTNDGTPLDPLSQPCSQSSELSSSQNSTTDHPQSSSADPDATLNLTVDRTLLDTTIAIEHKSKQRTQYKVRAIVHKKIIFKGRPKPIIANVAKQI